MMGYTHAVIGAGGALAVAAMNENASPELYLTAVLAGILGGVAIDIDAKDHSTNPKVTDAGRTRLATLGLIGIVVVLDLAFRLNILNAVISRRYAALGGVIVFIVLLIIGHFTEHRTFSHSLLFLVLTAVSIYFILSKTGMYCYFVGGGLHILLDFLNYQYNHHGIWLLYPFKTGSGIALGWCKAARTGNKVAYFIGVAGCIGLTVLYVMRMNEVRNMFVAFILLASMIIIFHFVRVKSEREQRHIMHMHGEL